MRILHTVEFYDPSIGGAQTVVKQLSERLVERGHEVTVATSKLLDRKFNSKNGVRIEEFDIQGNAIKGYKGNINEYKKFLLKNQFDIIMNYAAQEWTADLFFEVMDKVKAKKVLVPCGFSGLDQPRYQEYFCKMPEIMKKYDVNVFMSNTYQDFNFARKHGVKNVVVIPNGADEREFLRHKKFNIKRKLEIPENNFLILTVGGHTGKKGHKEAIAIFKKANISDATLLIVGNNHIIGCTKQCLRQQTLFSINPINKVLHKHLLVKELTRSDTVAAFQAADLFLLASKIECSPLVLFEAMASRTPFFTTDVGNAREMIEWSGSGRLIPATIKEATSVLKQLLLNERDRRLMAKKGFEVWKNKFTWDTISSTYEQLYLSLVK